MEIAAPRPVNSFRIRIDGFECGDNCYLHYTELASLGSDSQSALCSVDACQAWFQEQAMPCEFAGRSATITRGKGKQYDNDGNVMNDDFPMITSIVVAPAE